MRKQRRKTQMNKARKKQERDNIRAAGVMRGFRQLRKRLGYPQQDVAGALMVPPHVLSSLERGNAIKKHFTARLFIDLCCLYEVTPSSMRSWADAEESMMQELSKRVRRQNSNLVNLLRQVAVVQAVS